MTFDNIIVDRHAYATMQVPSILGCTNNSSIKRQIYYISSYTLEADHSSISPLDFIQNNGPLEEVCHASMPRHRQYCNKRKSDLINKNMK